MYVAKCITLIAILSTMFVEASSSADGPDFFGDLKFKTLNGQSIALSDSKGIIVVAFLGIECPVARSYAARLESLSKEYSAKGVRVVGVNSNPHDSEVELLRFTKELSLSFDLVKDSDQAIARRFGATRTAEVVVLDAMHRVAYRGRVDDQFSPGVKRSAPNRPDLQKAIDELIANKDVSVPSTPPVGCLITFQKPSKQDTTVSFCKTIAPIFYENCLECHRTGEIGPFDISNYDEVVGWAEMIVEVIDQKRMPPWHADPSHGSFKNARQMPPDSIATIREWVAAGMPFGFAKDLPVKPLTVEGWRLPKKPDQIVEMRAQPYPVPANGSVDYQYFVVDPGIQEDKWISAAQVIPGCPEVVHHAIVFIRPPDGETFTGIGWLTAYVPGQRATEFPVGYARRVPAGSKFVFQMHYTPNGQEQLDQSRIGLNFIEEASVTNEVFTLAGIDQEFEIPPGASKHSVTAIVPWLPKDGILLAAMPHMHLRGKSFQIQTRHADLESIILDVPNYDFNWQHTYEWSQPIALNDIDQLSFTAIFDNSLENPFNPNPKEYVMWGDQTWEEMAVAFFEVARPRTPGSSVAIGRPTKEARATLSTTTLSTIATNTTATSQSNAQAARANAFADEFLKRFDSNKDNVVITAEVSRIVRDYSFRTLDVNGDGKITRDELLESSRTRRGR